MRALVLSSLPAPPDIEVDLPFLPGQSPLKIKGLAYRGTVRSLEMRLPRGLMGLARRFDDRQLRQFLTQPFLAANWYDAYPMLALTRGAATALRVSEADFVAQRAHEQAAHDLRSVHRWLLRAATPEGVVRRLPRLLSQYFSFAQLSIETMGSERAVALHGPVPRRLLPWYTPFVTAYFEHALRAAGSRVPYVEVTETLTTTPLFGQASAALSFQLEW